MKDAPKDWYLDKKMVDAVNRCMEAICASGLSADSAEYLPACLEKSIKASNEIAAKKNQFVNAPISVEVSDGGFFVDPMELTFVL